MSIPPHLLAEWLLRGVLLSAAAAGAYLLLRPGGRARGTLLQVTTAGLLLLPLAIWLAPRWTPGWFAAPGMETFAGADPGVAASEAGGPVAWWVLVWMLGTVVLLFRIGLGFWTLARRKESRDWSAAGGTIVEIAKEAANEVGIKTPQVAIENGVPGPFAMGLWRPRIVLPTGAETWSKPVLRYVLLHEMAHIRRGDLWTQAAGNVVCALYWFNPLVWFLHRRLSGEREFLADALVLECGSDAKGYAHALLDVASSLSPVPAAPLTAAVGLGGASRLEDRVRRLLGGRNTPGGGGGRYRPGGAILIGLISVAFCSCLDPFAHPPEVRDGAPEVPAGVPIWTEEEIETRLSASPFPGE